MALSTQRGKIQKLKQHRNGQIILLQEPNPHRKKHKRLQQFSYVSGAREQAWHTEHAGKIWLLSYLQSSCEKVYWNPHTTQSCLNYDNISMMRIQGIKNSNQEMWELWKKCVLIYVNAKLITVETIHIIAGWEKKRAKEWGKLKYDLFELCKNF